ncbi:hypothetical protein V6N12_068270 [Hibiscus sabdariffa]|uniref:Zinc finger GRF-type domain-containing protein n=1 Tax=Hibiscus sabdariffa TaxID=183260 RepID=A0ABR2FPH4_9ROSI
MTKIRNWHEEEPSAFPVCGCKFPVQLRTSWSTDNLKRRFFGCKNYDSLVHHSCRYFSWFDPPMTPRARVVMVALLKRIKKLVMMVMLKYYPGYDIIIEGLIDRDKKDAFVARIHQEAQPVGGYDVYQSLMLPQIVACIIHQSALVCATALLQGHTGLRPDINAVDPDAGFAPLHCSSDDPELIELFLRYGARTDIRYQGYLPLCCAIDNIRATNEVEKEIYRYVKDGKIIQILALLMVAREEVTSPSLFKGLCDPTLDGSMFLRQLVLSEIVSLMASQVTLVSTSEEVLDELNNKLETMMSMLRLIEVFERAGDKIELHRRYLTKKEFLESIRLVACKTEEIEAIGCNLARQGKLIELASLLMVVSGNSDMRLNVIRRCITSDLQALVDSEVRLKGRRNNHKRSRLEIARKIQNLLEKAGFAMKPKDADLNDMKCFSPAFDPVDYISLPSTLRFCEFYVAEKKQLQRGSKSFHTMIRGNSKCRGPRIFAPTPKASKHGIPNVSGKNREWFLSLGVAITELIKRV